jgi:MFS family permease|uniref:MFS transporter n=1 Tax=Orrella sp. TaxID=1921583 RepID=UPI004047C405
MISKTKAVGTMGLAQIIASAAAQYLPAVIAVQAARALDLPHVALFAGFSMALVISALLGPFAGRLVDRLGGRPVLMLSNIFFAASLITLGFAQGLWTLILAYALMGLGLATGLFEVAFAALVRLFGREARSTITGLTLVAGFASFVGWTVSVYVEARYGWRGVCWFWALVHLCIGLPLHAMMPTPSRILASTTDNKPNAVQPPQTTKTNSEPIAISPQQRRKEIIVGVLLAYVFAANAFVGMGLMMHLPRLLQEMGVAVALAFTISSFVGPSQVVGRLIDYFYMQRWHPLISTRWAAACHPVAALLLMIFAGPIAFVFVLLHGIGNGILIIARGNLPLAIFGANGYGRRQGWLMMPAKLAQAAAPFLFGLALTQWGAHILWLTLALGLSVLVALCLISTQPLKA